MPSPYENVFWQILAPSNVDATSITKCVGLSMTRRLTANNPKKSKTTAKDDPLKIRNINPVRNAVLGPEP
jgi:hypothetical protein